MITCRKRYGRWHWRCTLCRPAVGGSTRTFDRFLSSLRHHQRVRHCHHAWVAKHPTPAPL